MLNQSAEPAEEWDPEISTVVWESVLSGIADVTPLSLAPTPALTYAVALREAVAKGNVDGFSGAERALLVEWLGRVARDDSIGTEK